MDAVLHRPNLKFKAIIKLSLHPLQLLTQLELIVKDDLNLRCMVSNV